MVVGGMIKRVESGKTKQIGLEREVFLMQGEVER